MNRDLFYIWGTMVEDDPDNLHAYAQSWLSMITTVLYLMFLIPAIFLFPNAGVWGLPGFALVFIMSFFLHGMHFDFDRQKRQVRVTRAWLYFFKTSSSIFDFKDVQFIEIVRTGDHDNIRLKMANRTYWLDGWYDVDKFFTNLCKMFPQFIPSTHQTSRTKAQEDH